MKFARISEELRWGFVTMLLLAPVGLSAQSQPRLRFIPERTATLAGQGTSYNEGGLATAASLGEPEGVAIDKAGNIFFADAGFSTVRRIDAVTGTVTTIAGIAPSAGDESLPSTARAQRRSGKQVLADRVQAFINKPAAARAVSPFKVGTRVVATGVSLDDPEYVALDAGGNVYFSDDDAQVVYKVTTDGMISIVAGTFNSAGYSGDGGPATSAQFNFPEGIALDAAGNLYIADGNNSIVRKVDINGNISTVAGTPQTPGYSGDGGAATSAQLSEPEALALDAAGNLYIADTGVSVVRKVDIGGNIATVAGNGTYGFSGDFGPATSAELESPFDIKTDAAGDLFIADYDNQNIRKVDAAGVIRTVAGLADPNLNRYSGDGGPATTADLGNVNALAVDAGGSLYTTLDDYNLLLKIGDGGLMDFGPVNLNTTAAQTLTVANVGDAALAFSSAPAIAGSGYTFAPAATNGCNFTSPLAPGGSCDLTIAFAPASTTSSGGSLTFSDNASDSPQTVVLRGVANNPALITTLTPSANSILAGQSVTLTVTVAPVAGGAATPTGAITIMSGATAVAGNSLDNTGTAVFTLTPAVGSYAYFAVYGGDTNYTGSQSAAQTVTVIPPAVTVSLTANPATVALSGTIYASAGVSGVAADPTGSVQFLIGSTVVATAPVSGGTAIAHFSPLALGQANVQAVYSGDGTYATASSNTVSVNVTANGSSGAALRFIPEIVQAVSGQGNSYNEGGLASQAQIGDPIGVAVDLSGNIYFADSYYSTVRRIDAVSGIITTIAGELPGLGGGGGEESRSGATAKIVVKPRTASTAAVGYQLSDPQYVAVDPYGNVFFSDASANVVYKVTNGRITIVAGTQYRGGFSGDGGAATSALLQYPHGVALDAAGNLYIADSDNCIVRKVDSNGNIATIAGTPQNCAHGGDKGMATAATLNEPIGIAVDSTGNLFIADQQNSAVREVDTTGEIRTVAGGNGPGVSGDYGLATAALLNSPSGVRVDAAGDLYIADSYAQNIRKVDGQGIIRTVAGTPNNINGYSGDGGAATVAYLGPVDDVALDPAGNVYTTLDDFGLLVKIGPGGLMDFGSPTVPASVTQNLTIANPGTAPLTFSGAPPIAGAAWSSAPATQNGCNFSAALPAGASCDLTVTFAPTVAGQASGSITFSDSAADSPQTVTLTGAPVNPASTTTLTASSNNLVAGYGLTLTTVVVAASGTGATPTGTMTITDGGSTVTSASLDTSGSATFTLSPTAGFHEYQAVYSGDPNYSGSQSSAQDVTVTTPAANVALTATPPTVTAGGTINASVVVTGNGPVAPTGNIQFSVAGKVVATVPLSGATASATLTPTQVGNNAVQATYTGDSNYESATSNTVVITAQGGLLQFTPSQTELFAGVPSDDNHGSFSGNGGPSTAATFHNPSNVAQDSKGNTYITEQFTGQIRRVDAVTGIVTAYAGYPHQQSIYYCNSGGDGGQALNASFCNPAGIAFDANDNLYIADYGNEVVHRVDAVTHVITLVAGVIGHCGSSTNIPATSAPDLCQPVALAVDPAGNVYIAEVDNAAVVKLDTSGNLTTFAGQPGFPGNTANNVQATSTPLRQPTGLAIDNAGNVYIADQQSNQVYKVDTTGKLTYYAGSGGFNNGYGDGGPATSASLSEPQTLALDPAGDLFIADEGHYSVRRVEAGTGTISTVAGITGAAQGIYYADPMGAPSTNFTLAFPSGIALDNTGALLIANYYSQSVVKAGPLGSVLLGNAAAGAVGAAETLTISNAGNLPFTFNATPYTVTGNFTVSAAPTSPCNFSAPLAAGASCNISVQYAPPAGTTTPNLQGSIVFSDSAVGSPQTAYLQVNGNPSPTTTELYTSGSPASPGVEIDFAAAVSTTGVPAAGTVSFFDGSTLVCSGALGSSGVASCSTTTLSSGDHSITAVYSGDKNYSGSTSDPSIVTVTGNAQTITLGALPIPVYGGGTFNVTATSSSGLPVTFTVISGPATGAGPFTITGAGIVMLQANQLGGSGFGPAPAVNFSVTVAPAVLTVTAGNAARNFDQPNPAFTYGIAGYVNGDSPSVVTGTPALTTPAIGTSPPGPYAINPAQGTLTAPNYTFTFVAGTLTVNGPAGQSIFFSRIPNLPVGTTMTLTARATSGLPVSYSIASGPATVVGNKLTATAAGPVTVTATQAGNANFAPATAVPQMFTAH
ncbi:MAG TPA: Ig-like domain repeat protein [Acidobacteriaceae bacterium]|nr:Ig-like domain repeat protein [Acidobacteriaceae bacterium]